MGGSKDTEEERELIHWGIERAERGWGREGQREIRYGSDTDQIPILSIAWNFSNFSWISSFKFFKLTSSSSRTQPEPSSPLYGLDEVFIVFRLIVVRADNPFFLSSPYLWSSSQFLLCSNRRANSLLISILERSSSLMLGIRVYRPPFFDFGTLNEWEE